MHHHHQIGILPIQIAVANASPGSWQDAIVVSAGDGWVHAVGIEDDRQFALVTTARPVVGEPVAVHPVAELLSIGTERYSAQRLPR